MFEEKAFTRHPLTAELRKIIILLLVVIFSGFGCYRPTALQRDYGNSWAYNEAIQIANPKAAFDQTPATGLSPQASTNVIGAYNNSFSGQKGGGGKSTTINLGGLTTAGSGGGGGN